LVEKFNGQEKRQVLLAFTIVILKVNKLYAWLIRYNLTIYKGICITLKYYCVRAEKFLHADNTRMKSRQERLRNDSYYLLEQMFQHVSKVHFLMFFRKMNTWIFKIIEYTLVFAVFNMYFFYVCYYLGEGICRKISRYNS